MLVIVYRPVKNNSFLADPPSGLVRGEKTNFILVSIVLPFNERWNRKTLSMLP